MKKKFDKGKKSSPPQKQKAEVANIEDINASHKGRIFKLVGVIDRVQQTGGPTVFTISDGTGSLSLKAFEGAGVRAHPDINEGDTIKAEVVIEEFRDALEGEVTQISKLSPEERSEFLENLKKIERERASIEPPEFMVESPILDKLKNEFVKAATEIRLAIIQNRPIIVRHHNDADGYSSGFALEKAIIPLIEKQHSSEKAAWEYYTRAPCSAPFYEIDDSIRDTATSLRNVAKFSNKMPLVIIADNGSTEQDLFGIQQGKVHGMDFIVIDHHAYDKDVISQEVLAHINPFLVGESGSQFSAGMLCTEVARFINPDVENMAQISAMASLADRIDNPEVVNGYLKLAEEQGYPKSLLDDIATVIDFVSAKLKFMEAREYIEVIFGEPKEKQKNLVKLMAPYVRRLEAKGIAMARAGSEVESVGKVTVQKIFVEKAFPGFGFYPRPGIAIGLIHDDLQKTKGVKKLVTLGVLSTAITIRATDEANFSVQELMKFINEKLPTAFIEGGGHKNAGSLNFVPGKQKEVLDLVREFIEKI